MRNQIDATIVFSPSDDEVTITVKSSDGTKLHYQDILDSVVDMIVVHYELVALPAERGYDDGLH